MCGRHLPGTPLVHTSARHQSPPRAEDKQGGGREHQAGLSALSDTCPCPASASCWSVAWSEASPAVGEDRDTVSCRCGSLHTCFLSPFHVAGLSAGGRTAGAALRCRLAGGRSCSALFWPYFKADCEELEFVQHVREGSGPQHAAWQGGESGPLSRGQQPSGVNSCQAKGKLDFCENWAALEVRTLRPVRGDFSEKGRLTTGRGRAADRPCCTAWKCEDSSVPVYWEALKIHRGVIFITLPQ